MGEEGEEKKEEEEEEENDELVSVAANLKEVGLSGLEEREEEEGEEERKRDYLGSRTSSNTVQIKNAFIKSLWHFSILAGKTIAFGGCTCRLRDPSVTVS